MVIMDNSSFPQPRTGVERENRDVEDAIEMSIEEADLVDASMEMED